MNPWVRVLVTFFLGGLGIHKFADKKVGVGILYLLTGGLFGIGWLIDSIKAIVYAINSGDSKPSRECTYEVNAGSSCDPYIIATTSEDFKFYPYETDFVDGASRQYRYEFNFAPDDEDSANMLWALSGSSRYASHELAPQLMDGKLQLLFNGRAVGTATFKLDMFTDWMRRGDPIKIYLLEVDRAKGIFRAAVDFYQDRRKYNSFREQSVVGLTSFKGNAKQETISLLSSGQEVEIDDLSDEATFIVTYRGEPIGKLPASLKRKISDEGTTLVTFERSEIVGETNDGDDVEQPFVRIYW